MARAQLHGARLLGLVRADASKLYGTASPALSGTDQVYGFNLSRFLADQDDPDQLVLTLYGTLAAGMTPKESAENALKRIEAILAKYPITQT